MTKEKKQKFIIGGLCAVVLFMAVGYAAFQTVLNITGSSSISSNWDIKITNVTTKNVVGTASNNGEPTFDNLSATFKTNLVSPGDSITYDITISNNGNLNAVLDKITLTDTNNPAIKFTTSGLSEGDTLVQGGTAVLSAKVEYLSTVTSQPASTSSNLTVKLDYSQKTGSGGSEITAADQLKENVVTTGDGLYKDEYEEGRYLYRGATPNNYITFNNEAWRIMSIESDDTLKIIKDEKLATDMQYDAPNARTAAYCNNPANGCNIWGSSTTMLDSAGTNVTKLPYQVGGTAYDLPTTEASLNTYLNGTYYNGLEEASRNLITSHIFNTGVILHDASQILTTDINQTKSSKWNGNIGLISAPDYVRTSTDASCTNLDSSRQSSYPCKNNNYLYKNYNWWTLSPLSYSASSYVWFVLSVGGLNGRTAGNGIGARPVSHLSSNLFIAGEGTSANPYTIETK